MSINIDIMPVAVDTVDMNAGTLKSYCDIVGLTQSELARRAGVSRQLVSQWFKEADRDGASDVNVYSRNQERLGAVLGVAPSELATALPILSVAAERKSLETLLLWDRLYPALEPFLSGLVRGQPDALARLVQVFGLYGAAKSAGQIVWDRFPRYKMKIHPAVRKRSEVIWTHHQTHS